MRTISMAAMAAALAGACQVPPGMGGPGAGGADAGAGGAANATAGPGGCSDDAFEDNDTQAAARALPGFPVSLPAMSLCDDDWFSVTARGGRDVVLLEVTPTGLSNTPIWPSFYDASNDEFTPSWTTWATGRQEFRWPVAGTGDQRFTVWLDGTKGGTYALTVRVIPFAPCADDDDEDNDVATRAADLTPGQPLQRRACPGDTADWYQLGRAMSGLEKLEVSVSWSTADGGLSPDLYDANTQQWLAYGSRLETEQAGTKTVRWRWDQPRGLRGVVPRLVVVPDRPWTHPAGTPYAIQTTLTPPPTCPQDAAGATGPTLAQATPVAVPLAATTYTLCTVGEEDWFEVPATGGAEFIDVLTTHKSDEGQIRLTVQDAQSNWVALSGGTTTDASQLATTRLRFAPKGSGPVKRFLRMALDADPGNPGVSYTLQLSSAPFVACTDDAGEDDDVRSAARQLTLGQDQRGTACPVDEDWYALPRAVAGGEKITLISESPDTAGVTVSLEGDGHSPTLSGILRANTGGKERVTSEYVVPADKAGRYWVMARSFEGYLAPSGIAYTLKVEVEDTCPDDPGEPNDGQHDATPVQLPYAGRGLATCDSAKADWYAFSATVGDAMLVEARGPAQHLEGRLELEVFDQPPMHVPGGTTITGPSDQVARYRFVAPATSLMAKVTHSLDNGDVGVRYDLDIRVDNHRPVVRAVDVTTQEDTPARIDLLANAVDADGDSLTVTQVGAVQRGALSGGPGRFVTYTPSAQYSGQDSFEFVVGDGSTTPVRATATVTVQPVNDPPAAQADQASVAEDAQVVIDVLANDSDPEGAPLAVRRVEAPSHGTARLLADGRIEYRPAANYAGPDGFRYEMVDAGGASDGADVTLTVSPQPDAPSAADDPVTTDQDQAVVIAVLVNDSDADGDALAVTQVHPPANGQAAVHPGGGVLYTPRPGFSGQDGFDYVVGDGTGQSDTGTVSVTVRAVAPPPPAGCADVAASGLGSPVLSGSTAGAGNDYVPSCYHAEGSPDVVVSWSAPVAGRYVFDLAGSSYDTGLAVLDAACGQELACNDDAHGRVQSEVQVDLAAGQDVAVVVDGFNGAAGDFVLSVRADHGASPPSVSGSVAGYAPAEGGEDVQVFFDAPAAGHGFPIGPVAGDGTFSGPLPDVATVAGDNPWAIDLLVASEDALFGPGQCHVTHLEIAPEGVRLAWLGFTETLVGAGLPQRGSVELSQRGVRIAQSSAGPRDDLSGGERILERVLATAPATITADATCRSNGDAWPESEVEEVAVRYRLSLAEGWNVVWAALVPLPAPDPPRSPIPELVFATPNRLAELPSPPQDADQAPAAYPWFLH